MDSFKYKSRKSQTHPFTSYQLARLYGWGFPELSDYTELEVCAGYSSVSLIPSSPFSAAAKHNHLPYRNEISHQQIPSDSFLTSQQPPASSSSSSLLPDASDTALSYPSHLGGFSPTPAFQNCHHEQQTFPGQFFQGGIEDSEPLWSAWRRLFGSSCYTNCSFSAKETVLPSILNAAIWPRMWDPAPAREWSIKFNFPQFHYGPRSQPAFNTSAESPLKKPEPMNQNTTCIFFGKVPCLGHFFMAFPLPLTSYLDQGVPHSQHNGSAALTSACGW